MPPPGNAGPPVSPLAEAVGNYRARFETTPWVWGIPEDRMPAWLDAIREATRSGRPLTEADLERVAGVRMPPPGAHT